MRWIYALQQMWYHQKELANVHQMPHVTDLTTTWLRQYQIQQLVLDFDGVLSPHGEPTMLPVVQTWLQNLLETWPEGKICILSNKRFEARVQWVTQQYPQLIFLSALRPKPYPETLVALQTQSGIAAAHTLIVDDRLLTGVLAGLLAHTQILWVTKPWQDYQSRPIVERFFAFLRFGEQVWLRSKVGK